MTELPIPATPDNPVVNLLWARLLEEAVYKLWDGEAGPRDGKREYICNTIGGDVTYDPYGVKEEISKRLQGHNYEAWVIHEHPELRYPSERLIQDGRRRWMLQLIKEFRGELK